MRKLLVVNIMSLDGYFEGPGHNVMVLPMDSSFDEYNLERMRAAGTVLLGAKSYEAFSGFWPFVENDPAASAAHREFSKLYNAVDKVVVSNHAKPPAKNHPWASNTTIVKRADARDEVTKLKQAKGGDIVMWGSRTLWHDLLDNGLVDELHLMQGPVVVGGGTHLFKQRPLNLKLLGSRGFDNSDNLLNRYEVLPQDAKR